MILDLVADCKTLLIVGIIVLTSLPNLRVTVRPSTENACVLVTWLVMSD